MLKVHSSEQTKSLTRDGVLDLRDVGEVSRVGDSKAAHAVSMPPLLKNKQTKTN